MKPLVGTDSCMATHMGYALSGRLHVLMDDGTEFDTGPGEAGYIPPGHDAWVVGDEPYVSIDVDLGPYATPTHTAQGTADSPVSPVEAPR